MSGSFRPRVLHDATARQTDPQAVVEALLGALVVGDLAAAGELLGEHVTYVNVGFPTIRGRRRAVAFLRPLSRPNISFEVYLHSIAANGGTVLTERTDVISIGPCRFQFWVTGGLDVQDGRVTLWRDSFDYLDTFRAFVRALVGAVIPPLRPSAPASADVAPGRH